MMMDFTQKNNRLMRLASIFSVLTAGTLVITKAVAFCLTGSVAVLSGLFDSAQDVLTSLVNLIAVREATTPADSDHRYGHGKAQAIGGLVQSFIILSAAFVLLKESVMRLFYPSEIQEIGVGLGVTALAFVLSFCLVCFQKTVVKRTHSLSIKADLAHYTGDLFMNIGIAASILCAYYLHWYFIDSLFGILTASYLFCSVACVLRESLNMLMDKEISKSMRRNLKKIVCSVDGVYDCFDLKTRLSGNEMYAQFSVALNDRLSLPQAHDKVHEIEKIICQKYPSLKVIIHPEPRSERAIKTSENSKRLKRQ